MTFQTKQEAFNHYRTATLPEIESRAAVIKSEISTNPTADVDALNIELDGLKEAKAGIEERSQPPTDQARNFNPITGMNFQTVPPKDEDIFASREYRSAFHKTMLNHTLSNEEAAVMNRANAMLATEKRAAFINTGEAAAVIPAQMLNEIYKYATDMGGVLSLVRRFDIPANVAVPVATPEAMAKWHVEGEEVTPDNHKPVNVIFNSFELMKLFSISANARTMSIAAYESYLKEELARTMLTALQYGTIHGSGNNEALGLLADGVITNVLEDKKADVFDTFLKATAALKRGYSAGAVWAMSNATLYNSVMAIMDGNGRPLLYEARDGNANRILGREIVTDDFIPDNVILFGNFHYYAMNYPQNIMIEVSRDSSFRKGLIDYRAMAIADGKPIISEAFVKLTLK